MLSVCFAQPTSHILQYRLHFHGATQTAGH
jgi:hypothetical protein